MMMMAGCAVFPFLIWFGVRIFFPKPLVKIFFPDIQYCKIFSSIICHERYFFQCRIILPGISLQEFFPSKSVCRIFFSEITHTFCTPPPSKIKWSAPSMIQCEIFIPQSHFCRLSWKMAL